MKFICQQQPFQELDTLRLSDRHSVLIEGPTGCGKTYLAMQYASMLGISDFQIVAPKVDEIKSAIEECIKLNNNVVICIENLDLGVLAASYTLLKFLEEPAPSVYIVVTCRSISRIPDTIISRSAVVVTAPPVEHDITTYALQKNKEKFQTLNTSLLWRCVTTFSDADKVLDMNNEHITYFNNLNTIARFSDSVSNIIWSIGHYPDNTETPIELVIRYLMFLLNTDHIQHVGIACLNDLNQRRIATHAILARFVFEAKYCE